jgi:hypothetical protein
MSKAEMTKHKHYWAGFCDDKLYFALDQTPNTKLPDHACLYHTKAQAKECFADVRKVRIVEIKP